MKKYVLFHPHFYMSIAAQTKLLHNGQKFSEKFFCKGVQLYFEISLLSFIHKIFEQNFYQYIAVSDYLVRIWTYKNVDEKAHTFSRSKNVKKQTKRPKKRILCKCTFILLLYCKALIHYRIFIQVTRTVFVGKQLFCHFAESYFHVVTSSLHVTINEILIRIMLESHWLARNYL